MAKIAFILLCHKDPEGIIRQAERLTAAGDAIAIHFDGRAKSADYERIRAALKGNPAVTFAKRRVKCGWGEWSLVAATLSALKSAVDAFPDATHFYMLSGDCMPVKSAEYAHGFLDAEDVDYIESVDFFGSDWIKTGIKEERLVYRHFFNERTQKRLFYTAFELQRRLGLRREIPADLQMMIGSQWWCLRRRTVEWVLDFCRRRKDVMRFFRTTWIPDETFFQTIVRHLVPETEIRSRTPTFLMFTDYGMPVTFYNDHYDLLLGQDYLFARKISPDATELKRRLAELWASEGAGFEISDEGRSLFRFLSGRGRIGRRFGLRAWEAESTLGAGRELLMVACKKWHVAKRLVERVRAHTDIPAVEYVFNEADTPMPDLGGIESSIEKRGRHRRSFLRMLFEHYGSDRLVICVDPSEFDLIRDLSSDRARTSLLEIVCDFSDDYLTGHARRVGLAGEKTPREVLDRLLPTIRRDIAFESERMRDADLPRHIRIGSDASADETAAALARFLDVPIETARHLAADHLYSD